MAMTVVFTRTRESPVFPPLSALRHTKTSITHLPLLLCSISVAALEIVVSPAAAHADNGCP